MANPSAALLAFGKLVAFFDEDGVVQFGWIGDPLDNSLTAMPANRAQLHDLLQSIIKDGPTGEAPTFPLAGHVWEPVNFGSPVGVGFVWNTGGQSDPLRIGIGAAANFDVSPGKTIDLAVLSRLIRIQNGQLDGEVPKFVFSGKFPVPDFLQSGSLSGEVPNPTLVSLTVDADATNSRTLSVPGQELAWDSVRVAVFVLQAWVRSQTTGGDTFFDRVDEHLFPMFGDPDGGPIEPFPLFGAANMGQPPDFNPWVDSVVSLDSNAEGALTFLWHLRALLTGNESSSFLDGSLYFPVDEPPTAGTIPTFGSQSGTLQGTASGAYIGIQEVASDQQLVILLKNGSTDFTIPLARNSGGALTRPNLTANPATLGSYPLPDWMTVSGSGPTHLTIFDETLPGTGGFGGSLKADLLLTQGQPVGYEITLPTVPPLSLSFPGTGGGPYPGVTSPEEVVSQLLGLLASAADGTAAEGIVSALQQIVAAALQNQAPDPEVLVGAILAVLGDQEALEIGDLLSIDLEPGGEVSAELSLDKVAEAFEDTPVSIGKAGIDGKLLLGDGGQPLKSVKFRLEDVRIDPSGAGAAGVAKSLLGDMRDAPGFSLMIEWQPPDKVLPSGGGKIPIQQTIGPLELSTLYVEVDPAALEITLDASFTMGPVSVTPYELGVLIPFNGDPPGLVLKGLGLSMDTGTIVLGGHFAEIDGDYVGAAVVSVVDFFELSAIGGYSKLPDGTESLFIFASLVAPLGGPPYFFVTGVAGGFGYNRLLPPPGPIADNPFMRVMRGEIALGSGPSGALSTLGQQFLPAKGQHWIAAGLQFVSFGFIYGKLVVVIGFPRFSLQLLGSAAFGIDPVAYFEIELQATADEELFQLIAGLSHNSYVIHPDIFSLHGQFAIATWYGSKHAGDFVFSIGGYHNAFPTPEHYPKLERVGVKATVFGFVKLSVECYFATTPKAMMAGASISLSAEFAGIGAGLDVYIDVYIQWDPFFIQGQMGVVVWFEFMGRHEIGVHLEIHTPPLGGTATIDLALVSFDIDFGSSLDAPPALAIPAFMEGQLAIEADSWNAEGASVAALSTEEHAGLFRLDMLRGRTATAASESDVQEGLDANAPIRVGSEFAFAVRTRLPVAGVKSLPANPPTNSVSLTSTVDLPLCEEDDLDSVLTVNGYKVGKAVTSPLDDAFPAAQFGSQVTVAQPDSSAKALIGSEDPDEAVVDLTEGILFDYVPEISPKEAKEWEILATEELSMGDERYPLPLGAPGRTLVMRSPKAQLVMGNGGRVFKAPSSRPLKLRRVDVVRQRIESRVAKPITVVARSAAVTRPTRLATIAGPGFRVRPPNVPVLAPPSSPLRRREMQEVALSWIETRVPAAPRALESRILEPLAAVRRHSEVQVAQPTMRRLRTLDRMSAKLPTGEALHLDFAAERALRGKFTLKGTQNVRGIFLGAHGQPVADLYLSPNHAGPIPPRARQVVFFAETADLPVAVARPTRAATAAVAAATPLAAEAIGIEPSSTMTALSPRTFAARGCVVQARTPLADPVRSLDTLAGADLLDAVRSVRIHFPAVPTNGTLVLCCDAVGAEAGSAVDQVRWLSIDAALRSLRTVTQPDRVAFTMAVVANRPWILEVDVGRAWRISAIAWRPQVQEDTLRWLASSASWDMIDDRVADAPRAAATTISFDLNR